jgi:diadenosine tetraphosphate (Ap4A) HIT family hydrolase
MKDKYLFPNETVFIGRHFKISQDWEVPIPGFFIISSLRDIRSFADFEDQELNDFIFLLRKLRKGMKEVLNIDDVYFFQNEDTKHGFHFWVFPRLPWMENFGRKIESVRPIMDYALKNHQDEENLATVKKYVQLLKDYFS